jgi:GxxExxY protein
MDENDIGTIVMTAAVDIHRNLGPGLLESVYEVVLAHTLRQQGLQVQRQVPISITYNGLRFDEGFRADIIVEGRVILELKCVEKLANGHKKQLLTYLKLSGLKLGYLFNFSAAVMRDGVVRVVNRLDCDFDPNSMKKVSRGDAENAERRQS